MKIFRKTIPRKNPLRIEKIIRIEADINYSHFLWHRVSERKSLFIAKPLTNISWSSVMNKRSMETEWFTFIPKFNNFHLSCT